MSSDLFLDDDLRPRDFHARVTRRGRSVTTRTRRVRRSIGKRAVVLAAAVAVPAMAAPGEWRTQQPVADVAMSAEAPARAVFEIPAFETTSFVPAVFEPTPVAGPAGDAKPMLAAGTSQDRFRAGQCLAMAAYYEAASEGEDGMRAVAQVVLNRVAHSAWPNTVCGVVFQGSERTTGCQFTFTCDGSMARGPSSGGWRQARKVADAALGGFVYKPVGLATHYHTRAVSPYWAPSLQPVGGIGAHLFYRWRGNAGQKAAFAAVYSGHEPEAAPHKRTAGVLPESVASLPAEMSPSVPVIEPQPARQAFATPIEKPADTLPAPGTVKAQYANSGRWLKRP